MKWALYKVGPGSSGSGSSGGGSGSSGTLIKWVWIKWALDKVGHGSSGSGSSGSGSSGGDPKKSIKIFPANFAKLLNYVNFFFVFNLPFFLPFLPLPLFKKKWRRPC
jgi:hypothetical protein